MIVLMSHLMLPGEDGLTLCRKLRAESGAAVPDSEVTRMAKRLIPSILNTDGVTNQTLRYSHRRALFSGTLHMACSGRWPNNGLYRP